MKKGFTTKKVEPPDAHFRPSQLIGPYGPGATVDLLEHAVIVEGLHTWLQADVLDEPRLIRNIQNRYGKAMPRLAKLRELRTPPIADHEDPSKERGIGVARFPTWFRCPRCSVLASAGRDQGIFEKSQARVTCIRCSSGRKSKVDALPVRFLAGCDLGHVEDFPWTRLIQHAQGCAAQDVLELHDPGTSDVSDIKVECRGCGATESLARAYQKTALGTCSAQRPWLRDRDPNGCSEDRKLLIRTASNSYFAVIASLLSIHGDEKSRPSRILDGLQKARLLSTGTPEEILEGIRYGMAAPRPVEAYAEAKSFFAEDAERAAATLLHELETRQKGATTPARVEEYDILAHQELESAEGTTPEGRYGATETFIARRMRNNGLRKEHWGLSQVVLVHRLREVRAQIGFTRFEALEPNIYSDYASSAVMAPLAPHESEHESWLPAVELWGEGVFLEFDKAMLEAWERKPAVQQREKRLREGFERWRQEQSSDAEFLGVRYYLLHSIAHALMQSMTLRCGYAASALKERIYCSEPGQAQLGPHMAGILIMTGSPGSEGTLGGLVAEGRRIESHLAHAIRELRLCSNDPICAHHLPDAHSRRDLEGAACHGCLYVAETSCERHNRALDRGLVVPLVGQDVGESAAFYDDAFPEGKRQP